MLSIMYYVSELISSIYKNGSSKQRKSPTEAFLVLLSVVKAFFVSKIYFLKEVFGIMVSYESC